MKRKHLALLALLLSQSTSLWGMEEITQLQEEIHTIRHRVQNTASQSQSQESIIILGPTGSGKTTLINLLAGKRCEGQGGSNGIKLVCSEPLPGFEPSSGNRVGTTLPNSWRNGNTGPVFWDCPGFGDPRGPKADILNAFGIRETFKGKVKFLLLAPESYLRDDRATRFLKLIKEATDILPKDQELKNSLSLVITKKERLNDPHDYIRTDILTLTANDNPNLTRRVRGFLEFVTNRNTPKPIYLIPSPTAVGSYAPNLTSLRENLRTTPGVTNPSTKLVVSTEARERVSTYFQTLNTQISNLINKEGKKATIRYCNKKINDHRDTSEKFRSNINETKRYLNEFKNNIGNLDTVQENNLNTYLNTLFTTQITEILPDTIITTPLKKKIGALFFLKNIRPELLYNVGAWKDSCSILINKIDPLTKNPEVQVNQHVLRLKGIIIGTSDIEQALQTHHQHNIKTINVFGLNTLFIDKNLTSSGTSLNLIAPCWRRVIGRKTINLKGLAGSNGVHGSSPGTDGQPGSFGGNGGNFYGKGDKCYGLDILTINTSGGNGGNGGNGQNGRNGANGRDGNLTLKTISGKTHYYHDQGTDGQVGGNGGRGGHGGIGGHRGYSVIDGNNSWIPISSDGTLGTNGNAGAGGTGGQHGRHCKGTFVTGLTKQEKYTEYRTEKATREETYEISAWEEMPIGGKIVSNLLSFGLAQAITENISKYKTRIVTYDAQVPYTAYRTVSLPDKWTVKQGYEPRRGSSPNGNQGSGFNTNGQQNPPTQRVLNREEILPLYREFYQQKSNPNSGIAEFVRAFPNLNQQNN